MAKNESAFTLIELMIVVAIMGVMTASFITPRVAALLRRTALWYRSHERIVALRQLSDRCTADASAASIAVSMHQGLLFVGSGKRVSYVYRANRQGTVRRVEDRETDFFPGLVIEARRFTKDIRYCKVTYRAQRGKHSLYRLDQLFRLAAGDEQ